MFLLGIGDILDEWTHKKSVADLAQSMSLNVDKVWLTDTAQGDVLVPLHDVQVGRPNRPMRTGGMIPLDGKVVSGEAMVNQASITGEPLAVRKSEGGYVYAGTVIEEGDCVVRVEKAAGCGRYDRIVHMIEESGKAQVRHGGPRRAPCRPSRAIQSRRNGAHLAAHAQRHARRWPC